MVSASPPKVSVIIPVHNAESTVKAAISSILRQSFADFEVVVVDDGSIDQSQTIVSELAKSDPRLRVISIPRTGIIGALNTAIAASSGELVARMDADDISHPLRLELQVRLMESRPDISVCSSLIKMFPRHGLIGGMQRYELWMNSLVTCEQIAKDMFVESPIAHPSAMLRRRELIDIGCYRDNGWAEDYDLWLRYHTAGKRFLKPDRVLVFWRHGDSRLTFTDSRYSVENFLRCKAHYLHRLLREETRNIILWGAGQMGRRLNKHLLREGLSVEAVIDVDADKIGKSMRGKPIVGVEYLRDNQSDKSFVIAAVGSHESRSRIRSTLSELGFEETRDFICAA